MMIFKLIQNLVWNPKAAAVLAAWLEGRPDIADDLQDICHRESRCQVIGPHEVDAKYSAAEWRGQTHLGHLDPSCQKADAPGGWATRGAFGLSAGAHWAYMPECYQPYEFDIPIISARVAAQKYIARCWSVGETDGWCKVRAASRSNNLDRSARAANTAKRNRRRRAMGSIVLPNVSGSTT